ncbi:MAG TPA: hypothetical protein VM537_22890 [Anaerolineae bacterium]|nr:hypothetical protein [Anaerolineae bacterium]
MLVRLLEQMFSDRWHVAGEVLRLPEGHPLVSCHKALAMDDDDPIFACPGCGRMFISTELLAQHAEENGCSLQSEAGGAAEGVQADSLAEDEAEDDAPPIEAPPSIKRRGRRRGVKV